jgi:hypothetical protein
MVAAMLATFSPAQPERRKAAAISDRGLLRSIWFSS